MSIKFLPDTYTYVEIFIIPSTHSAVHQTIPKHMKDLASVQVS